MTTEQIQELKRYLTEMWGDLQSGEDNEIGRIYRLNVVASIGERAPLILKAIMTLEAENERLKVYEKAYLDVVPFLAAHGLLEEVKDQ